MFTDGNLSYYICVCVGGGAASSSGYGLDGPGSIPCVGGWRFFSIPCPQWFWGHLNLLGNENRRLSPGVKAAERRSIGIQVSKQAWSAQTLISVGRDF